MLENVLAFVRSMRHHLFIARPHRPASRGSQVVAPAFQQWAACFGDRLVRTLRGNSRLSLEDALQELWLAMLRERPPAEVRAEDERLFAWLVGVARHRLLDQLRREARRHCEPLSETLQAATEWESDIEREESCDRVHTILRKLADSHESSARLLQLRYLEDRSVTEIAEMMGITRGAVKGRLQRAERTFRELWNGTERNGTE